MTARDTLTATHSIDLILTLGDAIRAHQGAIMSDVIKHSENGQRARHARLWQLIKSGIIEIVPEYTHPNNRRRLNLTPYGWAIYCALSRITSMEF